MVFRTIRPQLNGSSFTTVLDRLTIPRCPGASRHQKSRPAGLTKSDGTAILHLGPVRAKPVKGGQPTPKGGGDMRNRWMQFLRFALCVILVILFHLYFCVAAH